MKIGTLISFFLILFQINLAQGDNSFVSICYHDVRDDVIGSLDKDQYSVSTYNLISHFQWLRDHGYTIVSIEDILSAQKGQSQLPDRAVLLTFDDGYKSFYTKVFPLLKLFNYSAVMAIVGSWMEVEQGKSVLYGEKRLPRDKFFSWDEAKEMLASGHIEIASHSYDLHKGVIGNPQGNDQPAAITRIFSNGSYEDEITYKNRLLNDLIKSSEIIHKNLGVRPRVMVWPFGKFNEVSINVSKFAGLRITASLDDSANRLNRLYNISRILIESNPGLSEFVSQLTQKESVDPLRAVEVDLDDIYNDNVEKFNRNLDLLLDQIKGLKISHVFLKAYFDQNNNGKADSLYFANRMLPVRRDIFNRVAWQLKTRSDVGVFAKLPIYGFDTSNAHRTYGRIDDSIANSSIRVESSNIHRDNSNKELIIKNIFHDLAAYCNFDGLILEEEAYYNVEGTSSPDGHEKLKSEEKTNAFAQQLISEAKLYRPHIKAGKLIKSENLRAIKEPVRYKKFIDANIKVYDYIVLTYRPTKEEFNHINEMIQWNPKNLAHIILDVNTKNWHNGSITPLTEIEKQMRQLQSHGGINISYSSDGIIHDYKSLEIIKRGISLGDHPNTL